MLLEDKRRIAFESKKSLLAHKHPAEDNRGGNESEPAYCAASDQFAAAPAVPLLLLHVGRVSVLRRLQPRDVCADRERDADRDRLLKKFGTPQQELSLYCIKGPRPGLAWSFACEILHRSFPAMPWLS